MGSVNHTHIKQQLLHFSTLLNAKLYNPQIKIMLHSSLPFNFPPLFLKAFVDGLRNGRLHQINITHNQRCKCVSQVLVEPPILEVVYQRSKYVYSVRFTQNNFFPEASVQASPVAMFSVLHVQQNTPLLFL